MFKLINPEQLKEKMDNGNVTVVDIRDQNSFLSGHIKSAQLLDNSNVNQFVSVTSKDQEVVVCCYHGNSSQGAAQFLFEQGIVNAYSLSGGFEVWKVTFPDDVESNI